METATKKTFDLQEIDVQLLPELQGWKEKQEQAVKDNPFVEVQDHSTYTKAKKNRTSLVSARTDIQKQDKLIASKLKELRSQAGAVAEELIAITQPHEDKQQDEVKRYESKREEERKEKERIERERKQAIQDQITSWYNKLKSHINKLTINDVNGSAGTNIQQAFNTQQEVEMEEFYLDFKEKRRLLSEQFEERKTYLIQQEETQKEREKLAEERAEIEAKRKEEEKRQQELEQKARKIREAQQEELRKEREELEAEKQRLADKEKKRQEKEETERRAKEEAEAEAKAEKEKKVREKREKALRPDKEKLKNYINSVGFFEEEEPNIKNERLGRFLKSVNNSLDAWKDETLKSLHNIE